MVSYLTLDSSIIVAALRKEEEKHEECKELLERIVKGEFIALEPYTVLVELVAAIRRRTGSEELSDRVKRDIENIDTIYFLELTKQRVDKAAKIAYKSGIRGMDAIVVQIAEENKSILLSLDIEMLDKIKSSDIKVKIGDIIKTGI